MVDLDAGEGDRGTSKIVSQCQEKVSHCGLNHVY